MFCFVFHVPSRKFVQSRLIRKWLSWAFPRRWAVDWAWELANANWRHYRLGSIFSFHPAIDRYLWPVRQFSKDFRSRTNSFATSVCRSPNANRASNPAACHPCLRLSNKLLFNTNSELLIRQRLTPSRCRNDETGNHFFADYRWIRGWGRTYETLDNVVGYPHDTWEIGGFGSRGAHHHAQSQFLLKYTLKIHHVQIAHDRSVYHHDLVAFDNSCNNNVISFQTLFIHPKRYFYIV